MNTRIKEFTDLKTWQEGHKLVVAIYTVTKTFPDTEKFGLISQIRRASVSVTSNIAEGFGRQSLKEKIQFYYLAQGSLTEVKNQIIIAKDVGYIVAGDYTSLLEQANATHKLLQGLIAKSKQISNQPS